MADSRAGREQGMQQQIRQGTESRVDRAGKRDQSGTWKAYGAYLVLLPKRLALTMLRFLPHFNIYGALCHRIPELMAKMKLYNASLAGGELRLRSDLAKCSDRNRKRIQTSH